MTRPATLSELIRYRRKGKYSVLRAAIFAPEVVYTAQINQTLFATTDGVLEFEYDNGSGDLDQVLPDMTVFLGSTPGDYDVGICRLRNRDSNTFFISETSDIVFANDLYVTIVNDFGIWARHVLIDSSGVPYMDGVVAYSDQHTNWDPVPVMGPDRVIEMTEGSVEVTFDFSASYIPDGSAIEEFLTSSPTAASGSGLDTDTPSLTFNTFGWHTVYLTLTGENGKSFFGVRYVYVYDREHLSYSVSLVGNPRQETEMGGWEFEIELSDWISLDDIHDHSLVILFTEDYWEDERVSIGPVEGAENILCQGWIAGESIDWDIENGKVRFAVKAAHHWLANIPAFPDGVELVTGTPDAWTEIQGLTVDLGLSHFFRWRTTCTRRMDVFLTGDTKYTKEVSSMAGTLWEQIREMAWLQIYARAGVNNLGQLFVQVHPQMVPESSRDWPTVMNITRKDHTGNINLERITKTQLAILFLSGVAVAADGSGSPFFSMAPGHAYPHYGGTEVQDHLLVSGQGQANQLAGLYRSWKNNPFPDIPIPLAADIRLIDCFPRQQCSITIEESETPRGIGYSGNLFPKSITIYYDAENGYMHREVIFEAETFEGLAINGDIPGSDDVSVPPIPPLPPLPPFPPILPGPPPPSVTEPSSVLFHDINVGLILATNFDTTPVFSLVNGGLPEGWAPAINWMFQCKNGAVYVAYVQSAPGQPTFIARTDAIGEPFEILYRNDEDENTILYSVGGNGESTDEKIAYLASAVGDGNGHIYLINNGVTTEGDATTGLFIGVDALSWGVGKWMNPRYNSVAFFTGSGSIITGIPVTDMTPDHLRAGNTGRTFHILGGVTSRLHKAEDNFTTHEEIESPFNIMDRGTACDPTGQYLMSPYTGKLRSSDYGYTWSPIPNLVVGSWCFGYAGIEASNNLPRFIAAHAVVRYTKDYGETWINKENGTLTGLAPFPAINRILVLS